jgi:hypothetical protein
MLSDLPVTEKEDSDLAIIVLPVTEKGNSDQSILKQRSSNHRVGGFLSGYHRAKVFRYDKQSQRKRIFWFGWLGV